MIIETVRFVFVLVGAILGAYLSTVLKLPKETPSIYNHIALILYIIIGLGIGYVIGGIFGRRVAKLLAWIENNIQKIPLFELIAGVLGLVVGLVLAYLASLPLNLIPESLNIVHLSISLFIYTIFAALGLGLAARRWPEFESLFRPKVQQPIWLDRNPSSPAPIKKILDTNVIIDGRISDICKAGFIEGELLLPRFILQELQAIADDDDVIKRSRGRRGLDILNILQKDPHIKIEIIDFDYPEIRDIDSKLVKLAKEFEAAILTNDYNLNKVATLEKVKVLNVNDLANTLKPVVLPGEQLPVRIIKEGKEANQGVGYLNDGTMIVVEDGKEKLGETVTIQVTSILQTSAGRMVFGKLENHREKDRVG
jgi:uncharacterized protein YacL